MKIKQEGHTIEALSDKRIITLDDLLEATKVDKELWEVVSFIQNKRDVSMKDGEGVKTVENHQVKASLRPLSKLVTPDIYNVLKKKLEKNIPVVKANKVVETDNIANINHFDLHINRYEHNVKKYLKEINDRTMRLFELLLRDKPSKLLYVNGGDYFNSDIKSNTTKGTQQYNSMKEQEVFGIGLEHQIELIKTFASEMPVEAIYTPGNHAIYTENYLSKAVDIYFSKSDGIEVDSSDDPIKIKTWGNNAIAFMHGDMVKDNALLPHFTTAGVNKPYMYVIKGDKHIRYNKEIGNLLIDCYPSPASPDEWSKRNGRNKIGKIYGNSFDKYSGKVAEYSK
ncbi:MAG TPA: hypothetical protein PLW93_01370 [Candidatus Absconditabacterales bacterium]|nr:hypothetical protein [Candidatus Absconditabacterales bacterium]